MIKKLQSPVTLPLWTLLLPITIDIFAQSSTAKIYGLRLLTISAVISFILSLSKDGPRWSKITVKIVAIALVLLWCFGFIFSIIKGL